MSPLPFRWDGEALHPLPRFAKLADEAFVVGSIYAMEEVQDRSQKSHDHYFVLVGEAWKTLPDELAERFPTAEALRKHALIKAGWFNLEEIVCATRAEALRWAPIMRREEYSVVTASGTVLRRYTAKSQSMKAMGREDFQASKDAVLGVLAEMLGVEPASLRRAAA